MLGRYIIYEGVDHVGKSTMVSLSKEWLKKQGITAFAMPQPGATELGRKLREILKHDKNIMLGPETEAMMFSLDHMAFLEEMILPLRDEWILSDRNNYISGLIYQVLKGVSPDRLSKFYDTVMSHPLASNVKVDAIIIFQAPKEALTSRGRDDNKWDRYESNEGYMKRVHEAYRNILIDHSSRISNTIKSDGILIEIEASGDIPTVFGKVQQVLSRLI